MDQTRPLTAAEVLNTYPAARLAQVLREYGEERFARRIADAVVRERGRAPLPSTRRLAEIVRDSIPAPARRTGGNPGQADLPGAADRGQRRAGGAARGAARPPWTRWRSAAGSWCWPTTRSRTARSRRALAERVGRHHAARPAGAAGVRRGRSSGCSPGVRSGPPRRKWRPTRGPRRPGCGRPSGSGRRVTGRDEPSARHQSRHGRRRSITGLGPAIRRSGRGSERAH